MKENNKANNGNKSEKSKIEEVNVVIAKNRITKGINETKPSSITPIKNDKFSKEEYKSEELNTSNKPINTVKRNEKKSKVKLLKKSSNTKKQKKIEINQEETSTSLPQTNFKLQN